MSATDELRELAARMEGLALDTPDMLREAADAIDVLHESERRLMTQRNERLAKAEAENAKLRRELDDLQTHWELDHCPNCTARLDAQDFKAENSKLRELAHLVAEYTSADQCEGCVAKRACNAGELDMCWIRKAILEKLRELGVEVDE